MPGVSSPTFCGAKYGGRRVDRLCEGLTVGRALVALAEVVTGEKVCQKRMYGDIMAAISLASNGAGNWRKRHLRIRASVLRWALEGGEWLEHMPGAQLVADGLPKLLLGLVELGMCKEAQKRANAPTRKEDRSTEKMNRRQQEGWTGKMPRRES